MWAEDRYTPPSRRQPNAFARIGSFLASRPVENWLFFAAGVFLARILF